MSPTSDWRVRQPTPRGVVEDDKKTRRRWIRSARRSPFASEELKMAAGLIGLDKLVDCGRSPLMESGDSRGGGDGANPRVSE